MPTPFLTTFQKPISSLWMANNLLSPCSPVSGRIWLPFSLCIRSIIKSPHSCSSGKAVVLSELCQKTGPLILKAFLWVWVLLQAVYTLFSCVALHQAQAGEVWVLKEELQKIQLFSSVGFQDLRLLNGWSFRCQPRSEFILGEAREPGCWLLLAGESSLSLNYQKLVSFLSGQEYLISCVYVCVCVDTQKNFAQNVEIVRRFWNSCRIICYAGIKETFRFENNVAITAFKKQSAFEIQMTLVSCPFTLLAFRALLATCDSSVLFFLPNFYPQNFQVSSEVVYT